MNSNPRVVPVLLMLNLVVFIIWNFLGENGLMVMIPNFTVSWLGLMDGRIWTLLTSVFSHYNFIHFFFNMYVLMSFGTILEQTIGSSRFIRIYLVAGVLSSLAHAWVSAQLMGQPELPALGASGAISAVILIFSLLYPREKILLFFLIPLPAWWAAVLFVGIDVWGLTQQVRGAQSIIGHGAHLGGALTGLFYYYLFLSRPRLSRRFGHQRSSLT